MEAPASPILLPSAPAAEGAPAGGGAVAPLSQDFSLHDPDEAGDPDYEEESDEEDDGDTDDGEAMQRFLQGSPRKRKFLFRNFLSSKRHKRARDELMMLTHEDDVDHLLGVVAILSQAHRDMATHIRDLEQEIEEVRAGFWTSAPLETKFTCVECAREQKRTVVPNPDPEKAALIVEDPPAAGSGGAVTRTVYTGFRETHEADGQRRRMWRSEHKETEPSKRTEGSFAVSDDDGSEEEDA